MFRNQGKIALFVVKSSIMIQRVQSLFLLAAVALSALLLIIPVYELHNLQAENLSDLSDAPKSVNIVGNAFLMILNGAIGILSFVAIFFYKARSLQIRMCNLAMLLACVLVGLLFFLADNSATITNSRVSYSFGSYLPIIQVIFLFLAGRAIKRDDEMVRSADRLR